MKKLGIILLSLAVMLLPFVVSAGSVSIDPAEFSLNSGASYTTFDNVGTISEINSSTIYLNANLSDEVGNVLGTSGGEITFSFVCTPTYQDGEDGTVSTYISILNGSNTPGTSATKSLSDAQLSSVPVKITINITNYEKLASLKITNITLSGTPDAPPSIEPTPDEEPTPDGSGDENSPTPDGEIPSVDPSDTTTIVPETPTPTPTKTPGIIYEPTKDPYKDNTVTNAPPTPDPNINLDEEEIATPVPEDTNQPFLDNPEKDYSNSPETGLVIMFAVLFFLLGVDIIIIIWRKQMGYGNEINGGISRRKVREDLCDYPEDEEVFEDNFASALEESDVSDSNSEEISDQDDTDKTE